MRQIAALFVETGGTYYGLPGVDPWGAKDLGRGDVRLETPPLFRDLLIRLARTVEAP